MKRPTETRLRDKTRIRHIQKPKKAITKRTMNAESSEYKGKKRWNRRTKDTGSSKDQSKINLEEQKLIYGPSNF